MDSVEIHRCAQGSIILPPGSGHRGNKLDEEGEAVAPPALPPRPPPRPRNISENPTVSAEVPLRRRRVRKYVFLCTVCGGLAALLGVFFLSVYLTLRTYTSSLDYFETIPTYIPAGMLMLTGVSVMFLARRRNRYVFFIKLCGICCLLCAGTCVMVTVTTTVLHMSRLQSLRECVYTLKTQTCTCYSVLLDAASERTDEGTRYVFGSTPDCEVIHGALYSCLRALFGISVTGILVCIFCGMLVYQLLSHERKKMYWEELELRCRYLYGQSQTPNVPNTQTTQHCACCQQFRFQQDVMAWEPTDNRFWTPGHVGNLYSPNPVGDESNAATSAPSRTSSGWSWRRLPWARPSGDPVVPQQRESGGYHCPMNCSSPDSQYGFSVGQSAGIPTVSTRTASYTMIEPATQLNPPGCQVYQWGPPPPYSDPNSPSRRPLCPPGPHHHHCQGGRSGKESRQVEDYVNAIADCVVAAMDEGSSSLFSNDDSCVGLTLRIPSRKADVPPSSSSSSVKSNPNPNPGTGECSHHQHPCLIKEMKLLARRDDNINIGSCRGCISPRSKYLQGKQQNAPENPIRKQVQELTESEVYFADVSSCCNVSVKNDSMSIYDEALGVKPAHNGDRGISLSGVPYHPIEHIKKQPRFVHSSESKVTSLQTNDSTEGAQKRSECHQIPEEVMNFKRVASPDECFCAEMAMDGSEEDDPELVSFSRQRQTSLRNRMVTLHSVEGNKPSSDTNRNRHDHSGLVTQDQDNFPSPMSISSPSTASKGNGGFYAETVNSDNGSSDSVWMGYSPDFLAPDAQYETIPEHRLITSEDFNGNPKENTENRGNTKTLSPSKKKLHLQTAGENWLATNNSFSGNVQDISEERQRYPGQNINSYKDIDKARVINLNPSRANEKRLGNMMNSPKAINRSVKISNVQSVPEIIERRRGEMLNTGRICEVVDTNQCCVKIEDIKNCELLNASRGYDQMCESNSESQNSVNIFERCRDLPTSPPKPICRGSTVNTNLLNSQESSNENNCCHNENNCRCYVVEGSDQSEMRSVDV